MPSGEDLPQTPLERDVSAEVCVVGVGIAGLTTGWRLAQAGRRVVLLYDGVAGLGETQRTTAHLSNALDDRYYELERMHGQEGSRLAAESHSMAIDFIEQTVLAHQIDCDFARVDGFLFCPPFGDVSNLDREWEAAHRAGLTDVEKLDQAPNTPFRTGPCLRFPRQGQFHPLKYTRRLADLFLASGGVMFRARVTAVSSSMPAKISTFSGPVVLADTVVVATNTPINDQFVIHSKQAPYRTYVVGFEVEAGAVASQLWWDTGQSPEAEQNHGSGAYHYVRVAKSYQDPAREILVVGGEDHKTGQGGESAERWHALEAWTRERFVMAGRLAYRWSGQVLEPVDGVAYIGRNPGDQNVYVITGDSGHGMTHGTIGGLLIPDLIEGRSHPWLKLYDPSRVRAKSFREYLKENLNVAARYREYFTGGGLASEAEIAPGSGALLRHGLGRLAVYRDADGSLHRMSPVCPHLKCLVHWNGLERSWDCPCHGSRFDAKGRVLEGPAISDLEKVPDPG
jgi:glycine/D-amino acid oxidase-like deaminating enzyme/nitrite reductase/ring-hydroxylating ferredoxin subunit